MTNQIVLAPAAPSQGARTDVCPLCADFAFDFSQCPLLFSTDDDQQACTGGLYPRQLFLHLQPPRPVACQCHHGAPRHKDGALLALEKHPSRSRSRMHMRESIAPKLDTAAEIDGSFEGRQHVALPGRMLGDPGDIPGIWDEPVAKFLPRSAPPASFGKC